jgi:hypothetical protein
MNKEAEIEPYLIYRSRDDDKLSKILEQAGNQEINKLEAWKRLTVMLDAISNYKKDFNDKKKYLVKADK